ncbi:MAG: hypothetical protein ACRER5_23255, partial [Pseudomonas sp.]
TRFDYDEWGRMIATTLPDGTLMERSYVPHSVDSLPVRIQVTDVEAELPPVVVGEQTFDGLSRLATRTVGGRREQYFYEGGHLQVQKRITAAGNAIDYTYERSLGEDPQTIRTRTMRHSSTTTCRLARLPVHATALAARFTTTRPMVSLSQSAACAAPRPCMPASSRPHGSDCNCNASTPLPRVAA